jgi:hypothetical protein
MKPCQDLIENPNRPCQDFIENLDETKTSRSNMQKDSFFDIESKAALKKHDEREDEEAKDVEAILLSPFDPGIKKEPIVKEKEVKTSSEILIFEETYQKVSDEKLLKKNDDSNLSLEDFTENIKQPEGTPMDVTNKDFDEDPVKPKSNSQDSFFDDETKAVPKKHEENGEPKEEESSAVFPFDPGDPEEPDAKENYSEILIFDPQI